MFGIFDKMIEGIISPFVAETVRVLKYELQERRSRRMLCPDASAQQVIKGVMLLTELARSYPYRRQDLVEQAQSFLRRRFPQDRALAPRATPTDPPPPLARAVAAGIRCLTSLPRLDENGQPLYLDFHQMRVERVDLSGINFKDVTLWGCQFHDVILRRANFENADLGGTVFVNCSLEYANLKGAQMNCSFMDAGRPTTFHGTRLWRANLREADVVKCQYHPSEGEGVEEWTDLIQAKRMQVV